MGLATAMTIGSGVASAIGGFTNAAKQKKAAQAAEKEARKSMAAARKRADERVYDMITIPQEAYEMEYETQLQSDIQALSALQEADSRALAGAVGKVGAQQTQEAAKTRQAMADELFNIEKMKADEEASIKQQQIAMDVAEAQMADQRAYEAEQARQQALTQGFGGLTQAATAGFEAMELFPGDNPFAGIGKGKGAEGVAEVASGGAAMAATPKTAPIAGPSGVRFGMPPVAMPAPLTFGTAGITPFPGPIGITPPPKYNQPIFGSGRVYDRRGRLVDFSNR